MSIFSRIKDAIFGKKAQAKTPPADANPAIPMDQPMADPAPMSDVNVEAQLSQLAGGQDLNWRTSIVDLMKLVGIDASYENRKELAHELGDSDYSGTAEENIALHKAVMRELAKNGGNVPASMLD
jgi:hypothetical protein